jgi:hypothetical protein
LNPLEAYVQSFIVRVWLEEAAEGGRTAIWRGCVTHVPSGEQCYITQLDEIPAFVALHLEGWGKTSSKGT